MATRTFASLVPRLNPSVPGCPQYTMIQYVRDAAIRTCERTLAWRHVQPSFQLLPGVFEYAFDRPPQSDVHALFGAHLDGSPLDVLTLDQAIEAYPKWADLYGGADLSTVWSGATAGLNESDLNAVTFNGGGVFTVPEDMDGAGEPRSITQVTPDKFVVLPLPDSTKTYSMRMFYALKPARDADGMEKAIFDELEEAIVHNALQHLLVLPNVSWSDRELAAYHAKQFLREMVERRARANIGNARGTMRATAPRFA